MRKLLSTILCFLALCGSPAYAWPAHLAVSGGAYTGPGDLGLTAASGWWGLRAYNATWADGAHKAIQVLRSTDSQFCDVFLTTAGALGNVTSCSGAGSGAVSAFCTTNCTIQRWYDQSGNGRDMTQATGAAQATLTFSCLGALPCATFAGAQFYSAAAGVTLAQPFTSVVVGARTGSFTSTQALLVDNGNSANTQYTSTAATVGLYGGTSTFTAGASDSAFHVLQFRLDGGLSAILVDATNTTGSPGTVGWTSVWDFGSTSSGASAFSPVGTFTEFGVWPSGFGSSTLCHNAFLYWGTSTSC